MKHFFSGLVLFMALPAGAQSFEYFEDQGYRNEFYRMHNVADSMWIIAGNYSDAFYTTAYLMAIDTLGEEAWKYTAPNDIEVRHFYDVIPLNDGSLAVLGSSQPCCDCPPPTMQVHIINTQGELISAFSFPGYYPETQVMAVSGETILLHASEGVSPVLYAINSLGEQLWSHELGPHSLRHLNAFDNHFYAFLDDFALQIDEAGTLTDTILYDADPMDVAISGDRLMALFEDGLFSLNEEAEGLHMELLLPFDSAVTPQKIVSSTTGCLLWNDSTLWRYDDMLQPIDTLQLGRVDHFEIRDVKANAGQLAMAGARRFADVPVDFHIYRGATLRSISLEESTDSLFPDLALDHLTLDQVEMTLIDFEMNLYSITGVISGYLKNTGNITVNKAHINELHSPGICGLEAERVVFEDIGLQPGDSLFFSQEVGPLNYDEGQGAVFGKACLFVSAPNNLHDRNEANDISCTFLDMVLNVDQVEVISAVFPNPASDQIAFRLNTLQSEGALQIYNATGKMVSEIPVQDQVLNVNVASWTPGMYFARFISENTVSASIRFSVVR